MSDTSAQAQFQLTLDMSSDAGLTEEARRNRDLLIGIYRRIERGEMEVLAEALDPDVSFHEAASLPYGGDMRGKEAALAGMAGMFAAWRSVEVVFYEFCAAGDLVFAYHKFSGVARATGLTYEGQAVELFRFRDGRIVEWRPFYWDTHAAMCALGVI
ncbi:hypothetical protein DM806_22085 [Sphingobium lactosutens]|uniref:nuclear transport factor 2 family protein n=1 Tax=Sphingobium lactosutens TaxID=522773 RepID=UPI0015BA7A96|nr:nuclear transport factor 2 family protein [Sphingobium lactosutens]NWK98306.1 hypothetical protein [Sphingobium lactosutens]